MDVKENSEVNSSRLSNDSSVGQHTGRMGRLRAVMDRMLNEFIPSANLTGPITNADPDVLRSLQKEAQKQLQYNVKAELDQFYSEHNLEALLCKLDEMAEQSAKQDSSSQQTWRPSGNIAEDSRPHITSLLHHKQKALQKTLDDLEAKNKLLRVAAQKREECVLQLHSKILNQVSEYEKHVDQIEDELCQEVLVDQLLELRKSQPESGCV